ncbi:hypothetical protein GCM10025779_08730 [Arthrobacter cryoconiti]
MLLKSDGGHAGAVSDSGSSAFRGEQCQISAKPTPRVCLRKHHTIHKETFHRGVFEALDNLCETAFGESK